MAMYVRGKRKRRGNHPPHGSQVFSKKVKIERLKLRKKPLGPIFLGKSSGGARCPESKAICARIATNARFKLKQTETESCWNVKNAGKFPRTKSFFPRETIRKSFSFHEKFCRAEENPEKVFSTFPFPSISLFPPPSLFPFIRSIISSARSSG